MNPVSNKASQKYAILGDIHGNWPALEAVLADAKDRGATATVCVGDIVGYNAEPGRCLDKIVECCSVIVRGNHDHYCCTEGVLNDLHPLAAEVVQWTRAQLSQAQVKVLADLKYVRRVGGFTVVHSTLDMPEKWGYVFDVLEADANFNYQSTGLCFHGHTHVPVVFERQKSVKRKTFSTVHLEIGSRYFINVGSVGQPRDGDSRASYVIYNTAERTVELRRVTYDVETAQARIREAGLPERLARRLEFGK